MGGSPKPPSPSAAEEQAQKDQLRIQEEQLALARQQAASAANIKIPKVLPTPPPPTTGNADIAAAAEDAAARAAKRTNSARGTLFAGETGGYQKPASGGKTLLG